MASGDSHSQPISVPVNGTVTILGSRISGFVPATTGTIAITIVQGEGRTDQTLPTIPVTAGVFLEMPIFVGTAARSTLVAAGGASGVLLVS
jgi:hypothetical protein